MTRRRVRMPWTATSALLVGALLWNAPTVHARGFDDSTAGATAEELITDRPDQTESAAVVPRGHIQIESGWTFSRLEEDGVEVEVQEIASTLVRIGLERRFELRLAWGGYVEADSTLIRDAGADGLADAELGFKLRLAEERGARPEIAILAATSLPVGDDALTSDRADPAVRIALAHTLNDRLALGYNLGAEWTTALEGDERTTLSRLLYTIALGISLRDSVGAFVELFGDFAGSAGGSPAHAFDGGFTFLVRDNLQLDLAAGTDLDQPGDNWFVGAGVSLRLPR